MRFHNVQSYAGTAVLMQYVLYSNINNIPFLALGLIFDVNIYSVFKFQTSVVNLVL